MPTQNLGAVVATRKSGTEPLTIDGNSLGVDLQAFWQWSSSDVLSNSLRGVLAEYIVATALGCNTGVRTQWDAYDIKTESGIRIEVKSAAYLQSWSQKALSPISFSVAPALGWDAEAGARSKEKIRPADVYVFCLLAHQEKSNVNPLDLNQWEFYCLNTQALNQAIGPQRNITLSRLQKLGPVKANYLDLAKAILAVTDNEVAQLRLNA